MTNEIERNFEFIVNQQARFSSDLQVLDQVAQTQAKLAEAQERTDSSVAELAQAQKHTDETLAEGNERMNSLILIVERYFSNGGGGAQ